MRGVPVMRRGGLSDRKLNQPKTFSQESVAAHVGVSAKTIKRWWQAKKIPSPSLSKEKRGSIPKKWFDKLTTNGGSSLSRSS